MTRILIVRARIVRFIAGGVDMMIEELGRSIGIGWEE